MCPPRAISRVLYRVAQLVHGVRTDLDATEVATARELLSEAELRIFAGMLARDRRHSMNVLLWLRAHAAEAARPSRALLAAALLHDCGKGDIHVIDRIAFVLLGAISRRLTDGIARKHGARWRYGIWRLRHHAALGAERLAGAASDARTVTLVARHGDGIAAQADEELRWLREADAAV